MPQTRFVLSKALELGHKVIVVVNKIDRPDQRIHEVVDEVLELLLDLNATDEQFESPTLFCSGRQGTASYSPDTAGTDLTPLFETIVNYIPGPEAEVEKPFQMLVPLLITVSLWDVLPLDVLNGAPLSRIRKLQSATTIPLMLHHRRQRQLPFMSLMVWARFLYRRQPQAISLH